jgi:hypothetical protein
MSASEETDCPCFQTNQQGVCLSTAGSSSSNLSYDSDPSEGSVIRELTVIRLEEEGHYGGQPQRMYFVECLCL